MAHARSISLHFRRIELKYKVPRRIVPFLLSAIRPYVDADPYLIAEGKGRTDYPLCSLYYDSYDLQAYQEKLAGVLARCKVRLRTYAPYFSADAPIFLEVKRRWDLAISKDRFLCPPAVLSTDLRSLRDVVSFLLKKEAGATELSDELQLLLHWYNLQSVVLVRYRRCPFVGKHHRRFRITLDSDIESVWKPAYSPVTPLVFESCIPHHAVLELKSNLTVPAWFHDIVRQFQLERLSVSKYALAVQSHLAHVTPVV